MIFVTIGTMYGFPRLIKEMDRIAKNMDEEIIMQIGETIYEPTNAKYFRHSSREEMNEIYRNSRIVVCHAGIGSILSALKYDKHIIVVPRSVEYNEVVDNHQFEIARELETEGIINVVYDINDLNNILMNVKICISNKTDKKETALVRRLKEYINQLHC